MGMKRALYIFAGLAAAALIQLSLPVAEAVAEGGRVPLPVVPKALKDAAPGHAERMRTRHMVLMVHKRDETMRRGIRTEDDSLKACVSCHAVRGPGRRAVAVESPKHFCRACHDFAAVRIDCFSCHASRPPEDFTTLVKKLSAQKGTVK